MSDKIIKLLLPDVVISKSPVHRSVACPAYVGENFQVSRNEYSLQITDVGSFFAKDGRVVEYSAAPGADDEWVKLYLHGQVLVALLHQRGILNFHASSFIYDGLGVMVLGETGAGKSSLTVSFALAGAGFLTDDLTPVIYRDGIPFIWPLGRRVKIRENTASQLNIETGRLADAEAGTGKKYLNLPHAGVEDHMLHIILKIETGDAEVPVFHEPSSAEKFSLLRSEICSWEILAGMPETEREYLQQLVQIVEQVHFVKVVRPAEIPISTLYTSVKAYLEGQVGSRLPK